MKYFVICRKSISIYTEASLLKFLHRTQSTSTATAQPPYSAIQSENTLDDWTDIREWMDSDFVNWVPFIS
jgi:hypothetical protein